MSCRAARPRSLRGLIDRPERRDGRLVRAGEDAVQRVVVGRRDRVELVVVAAGARDGQPHQPARHHVDPVVDDVVRVVEEPPAERQEAHRRQRPAVVARRQQVGGELLDDELVVRHVLVERADDVVAVGVRRTGSRRSSVEDVPLGVGVAGHVEPVPAPALAVVRARRAGGRPAARRRRARRRPTNASTSSGVGGRPVRSNVSPADQRPAVRLAATASAPSPPASPGRSGRPALPPSRASRARAAAAFDDRPERPVRLRPPRSTTRRRQAFRRPGAHSIRTHVARVGLLPARACRPSAGISRRPSRRTALNEQALVRLAGDEGRPGVAALEQPPRESTRRDPFCFLAP